MTPEQLIEEGRRLQRPCVFLRPEGSGPAAAFWYEYDADEVDSTGYHCWLTVDARHIPDLPSSVTGYISVFTDEGEGGRDRVEIRSSWPERAGTPLYAHPASVLPPIDAVFAHGSEVVGEWLHAYGWERTEPYDDGFGDAATVRKYERVFMQEFPLYFESDIYAVLGGWHVSWPDGDWHELLDEQLMVFTFRDSEPWVEAWLTRAGDFRVIQRIT